MIAEIGGRRSRNFPRTGGRSLPPDPLPKGWLIRVESTRKFYCFKFWAGCKSKPNGRGVGFLLSDYLLGTTLSGVNLCEIVWGVAVEEDGAITHRQFLNDFLCQPALEGAFTIGDRGGEAG